MTWRPIARPGLAADLVSCLTDLGIATTDVLWLRQNPRAVRTLRSLVLGPQSREAIDHVSGSSNGPNVVMRLRRQFRLVVPCAAESVEDRDGLLTSRGVYKLTARDAERARRLLNGLDQMIAHSSRGDESPASSPESRALDQDGGGAR
jgi:hypothetical protein